MGFAKHLRCDRLVEVASDYLDKALSQGDLEQIEQHLLICGACAEYVAQIRSVRDRAGRLLPEREAPLEPESEARLRALLARFKGEGAP